MILGQERKKKLDPVEALQNVLVVYEVDSSFYQLTPKRFRHAHLTRLDDIASHICNFK